MNEIHYTGGNISTNLSPIDHCYVTSKQISITFHYRGDSPDRPLVDPTYFKFSLTLSFPDERRLSPNQILSWATTGYAPRLLDPASESNGMEIMVNELLDAASKKYPDCDITAGITTHGASGDYGITINRFIRKL